MTPILVDSNVLLDVITQDPIWGAWSARALEHHADEAMLVINPIIHAEVSIRFQSVEELDAVLADEFIREPLPFPAGFLAGKSFMIYRKRGGTKHAPLADFYIGAHAAINKYRLLTRDASRYRSYFPSVDVICP